MVKYIGVVDLFEPVCMCVFAADNDNDDDKRITTDDREQRIQCNNDNDQVENLITCMLIRTLRYYEVRTHTLLYMLLPACIFFIERMRSFWYVIPVSTLHIVYVSLCVCVCLYPFYMAPHLHSTVPFYFIGQLRKRIEFSNK